MLKSKKISLSGWGNFLPEVCTVYRPEKQRDVKEIINWHQGGLIARGCGRSYGDAAINQNGVIASERLNKFIEFDTAKGILTAEAGVLLQEIIDITALKGWFPPVIPGTKYVSLGGAVAGNIHGKNHYKHGDIAEHVLKIKLLLPNGETTECSAAANPDIFWATAGGLGMTGYIREVTLKLLPIESISLKSWRKRVNNIEEMLENFRQHKNDADYMIGWIDHFAKGGNLGKGVFEKSSHASLNEGKPLGSYKPKKPKFTIPKFFPSFILNKYSMAAYNALRFIGESKKGKEYLQDFNEFFHPLDSLNLWNRMYGRKGLLQYQFIVPEGKNAAIDIENILRMIQNSGNFSFLAVIKYHRQGKGLMTFPILGYSVALDFPATKEILQLLDKIDEELCKISGRIYLAKDARVKRNIIQGMYGDNLGKWKALIKNLDPLGKITSHMAQRLGFKE